jgi:2,5-diketo-D-gluconate reductase A
MSRRPIIAPTVTLANGVVMPTFGLGTWPLTDDEAETTVTAAIRSGYRLIDTAENYENERGVGRAIRASGIDPEGVFVTTKLNGVWHSYDGVRQALANSTQRLGRARIDLFLIHWPLPTQGKFVDAWRGMVKLLEDGDVRAIGVSNFTPQHLDRLLDATGLAPHVNQLQLNPRVSRRAERLYHTGHGIVTESWAPLDRSSSLLDEPAITAAARRHNKTPAQTVLRWHVQLGLVAIPKTMRPDRLAENIDVFDFALSDTEMDAITALDRGGEGVVDADIFGH